MRLLTSVKLVLSLSLMLAVVYWGGSFYDAHFHSLAFMNKPTGLELDWSDLSQRDVASDFGELEGIDFPFTKANQSKIYGLWHIFKYINVDGSEEAFDVKIRFTLVDDGLIQVGDTDQFFKIGHIYEDGVYRLFKEIDGGVEQIFARKVFEKEEISRKDKKPVEIKKESKQGPKGLIGLQDADLVLEKVYNPSMAKIVVTGDLVSGSLSIVSGSIQGFEAEIIYSQDKQQTITIDYAQINDGGQFEYEYEKDGALEIGQGLFTNNGKGAYKIRFATGPYQGAYLNFLTYEAWEEKEYQKQLAEERRDEQTGEERMNSVNRMVREKLEGQTQAVRDRGDAAREKLKPETVDVTPAEMEQRLKTSGFAFGSSQKNRPSRVVASIQK